ncbi:hypothetical protein BgiBS90_015106, partial [Biomphalaria glabrata]
MNTHDRTKWGGYPFPQTTCALVVASSLSFEQQTPKLKMLTLLRVEVSARWKKVLEDDQHLE